MNQTIATVIATRNRCGHLRQCLDSLRVCEVPAGWLAEVIVVNNGGTDEARDLLAEFANSGGPVQFRYLYEPRRGKGFAVNSGVAQTATTILAFTDDDAIVDRGWFAAIVDEFRSDEALGLLAGRVEPLVARGRDHAVTRQSERKTLNGLMSLEGSVLGCNLAIRPHVLDKVKGRDTRLGPGRGLSCEDIDFTHRVIRCGFRAVFSPKPLVYHEPGERDRTREYLRGWGAFYLKFVLAGDRGVARQAWWKTTRILRELFSGRETVATLNEMWQLGVGASIMAKRMVFSRMT